MRKLESSLSPPQRRKEKQPKRRRTTTTIAASLPNNNNNNNQLQLERLLQQLEAWFVAAADDDDDHACSSNERQQQRTSSRCRVPEFTCASHAAAAVEWTRKHGTAVGYDSSLNGWWKWYQRARQEAASGTTTFRHELRQDVLGAAQAEATAAAQAVSPEDVQLARLTWPPPPAKEGADDQDDGYELWWDLLQQLLPSPSRSQQLTRSTARIRSQALAKQLWPVVEHDNGPDAAFDFTWMEAATGGRVFRETTGTGERGLAELIRRLWACAAEYIRAISLTIRVRTGSALDKACQSRLDRRYQMSDTICPAQHWCVGPPATQAVVDSEADAEVCNNRLPFCGLGRSDRRYYLIIGTPGALTKSHWDRGVQSVLYHTVAGTNRALAVPRRVAQMLHAIDEGASALTMTTKKNKSQIDANSLAAWSHGLECDALKACQDVVQAATFRQGETMLILPAGGHAILTGDQGKVVLAGEWHLRTDVLPSNSSSYQ